jgi:hypothetical protein
MACIVWKLRSSRRSRLFAWQCHNRRLSKDYKRLCSTGEAFVYAAMMCLMASPNAPFSNHPHLTVWECLYQIT